ncbi:epoxyqueuosine reductase QueH [Campylobacter geochelonis]|uniref:Epoxyqueuosine reductase QueH n=1 Tax=Campylobacter geochelonis TaxID=1780362 RepID=A0A128EN02_9BACT|nr:epoxyqueuosine reductase QueH [Campylobacter geochelonis]CZE45983.1 FIG053235: Diacylglucosamine hydrolase like [Campylobacter geochelonis]CZE50372.1 FIG053235: Diacylglucosamine hydrolase like [Campylobacter geochelonis]
MVVQICCSVDSHYFIKRLKKEYPEEKITGYFYDPNIHPYSEFMLRYQDVVRSCDKMGIKVHLGEYELDSWFSFVKGLENEPEKGARCQACFDFRMEKTALFAKQIGEKTITTTLLMSPKKSHEQLENSLEKICSDFGLDFVAPDYRKGGGTQEQFSLAKSDKLYHQNYCGCMFALKAQNKKSLEYELLNLADKRVLPNSAKDRINLYKNIIKCEEEGLKFKLLKDKFINYRLLRAVVKFNGVAVPSHFLFNSHFERSLTKFSIENQADELNVDKEQIKLITLAKFNQIANAKFSCTKELVKSPLSIKNELEIREKICKNDSFSPIVIVDEIYPAKVIMEVFSTIYLDVREILVRI